MRLSSSGTAIHARVHSRSSIDAIRAARTFYRLGSEGPQLNGVSQSRNRVRLRENQRQVESTKVGDQRTRFKDRALRRSGMLLKATKFRLSALVGTAPFLHAKLSGNRAGGFGWVWFVDCCLRGVAQVCFCNNPVTGIMFLIALLAESWYLTIAAVIGTATSTGFAVFMGFDKGSIQAGLFGYNGVLTAMGMVFFAFGGDSDPFPVPEVLVFIYFMCMISALATVSVGNVLAGRLGISPFTFPFQIATWCWLLVMQQSMYFVADGSKLNPVLQTIPETMPAVEPLPYKADEVVRAFFTSISQIFFLENPYSGALIVAGISVCSLFMASATIAGSVIGVLTSMALGIPGTQIYQGLWGYNSALTSIAIGGVFFVPHGTRMFVLWLCSCAFTVVVDSAVRAFFSPTGLPSLTFPFTAVCWLFCLISQSILGVIPVELAAVSTPEDHLRRFRLCRALLRRMGGLHTVFGDLPKQLQNQYVSRLEHDIVPIVACDLVHKQDDSSLRMLIKSGADITTPDYDMRTPLHIAACVGSAATVDLLLNAGALPDAVDRFGNTPLIDAILHRNHAVVATLSRRRAKVADSDHAQDLAFWCCAAAFEGDCELLDLFIVAGCNMDTSDYNGRTPLMLAAAEGRVDATRCMLSTGVSIARADCWGNTALSEARRYDHQDVAQLLSGSSVDRPQRTQMCASDAVSSQESKSDAARIEIICEASHDLALPSLLLCNAASQGDLQQIQKLLERYDVSQLINHPDYDGRTPLHLAAAEGALSAAEYLLSVGASPNALDRWGRTPLEDAILGGNFEVADVIVSSLSCNNTAYHRLGDPGRCHRHHRRRPVRGVRVERRPGHPGGECDVRTSERLRGSHQTDGGSSRQSIQDRDGLRIFANSAEVFYYKYRLLSIACSLASRGDCEVLPQLYRYGVLAKGASDYDGQTLLHIAAACGHTALVRRLLQQGLDPSCKDRWGRTPFDAAAVCGQKTIVKLLSCCEQRLK